MQAWLPIIITICVFTLMLISGLYTYRFLNNKLTSSNSWAAIIFYAIALAASLAAIFYLGFLLMGLIYNYLAE